MREDDLAAGWQTQAFGAIGRRSGMKPWARSRNVLIRLVFKIRRAWLLSGGFIVFFAFPLFFLLGCNLLSTMNTSNRELASFD